MSANMFATDPVKIFVNFPTQGRPADANIEMVGSFTEGTMWMEKIIATGWFVSYEFVNANADDTFKFRDKTNNDLVLCKYIAEDDNWVQAYFKFGDSWQDDSWKGDPCKLIEEDISDPDKYAWMTGKPDPLASIKNITVAGTKAAKIVRDGKIYILKNGKTYNALGAKVK